LHKAACRQVWSAQFAVKAAGICQPPHHASVATF
jgi:hypothetical protein